MILKNIKNLTFIFASHLLNIWASSFFQHTNIVCICSIFPFAFTLHLTEKGRIEGGMTSLAAHDFHNAFAPVANSAANCRPSR